MKRSSPMRNEPVVGEEMELGKVSEAVLKRSVFNQIRIEREEVLVGAGIGEDCSVICLEPEECLVLSTDPITATSQEIGELAVHVTLNDLAAAAATPIGLMLTLLLPPDFPEAELKQMMKDINQVAGRYQVQIIGGHTEVTAAVNQVVISVTGVGKIAKAKRVNRRPAIPELDIVMTKWAGIEGTYILAKAGQDELKAHYNERFVQDGQQMNQYLSIVSDSQIASNYDIYAMHDVTEGGIYGALWELGSKLELGLQVDQNKIPIRQETIEICEFYDLNPYKLIGSGCLLVVTSQGPDMVAALRQAGIEANVIGKTTADNRRQVVSQEKQTFLEPAKADELYKGLDRVGKPEERKSYER